MIMFETLAGRPILTYPMVLWNIILYLIIVVGNWRYNVTLYHNSKYQSFLYGRRTKFVFFLFLLFVLTWWIGSDFWAYIVHAKDADMNFDFVPSHRFELGEQFVASIANGNWLGFRIGIWGVSLVLFILSARRMQLNIQHSLFILFVLYYDIFSYGRVTLAMATYFYGLTFLCKPVKKLVLLSVVVGVMLILSCQLFHRSAIVLIPITPIIYILAFSKRSSFSYLITVFVLISIIFYLGSHLIYSTNILGDVAQTKLEGYTEREMKSYTVFGKINNVIEYIGLYLPCIVMVHYLRKIGTQNVPIYIYRLMCVCLCVFVIATVFYFSGEAQFTLFYRTLYMTMIPASMILSYLHTSRFISRKQLILIFLPSIICAALTFLSTFSQLIKGGGVIIVNRMLN